MSLVVFPARIRARRMTMRSVIFTVVVSAAVAWAVVAAQTPATQQPAPNADPYAKAVPGVRVAYTDEREIQHALDAGALVLVVPTVDSKAEAIEARNWTYFPPLGRRSNGGGQAFDPAMWGGVPGGYRNTINDNVVLVEVIETLEGLKDADQIAKVRGDCAVVGGCRAPGNLSGYRQGPPACASAVRSGHA